MTGSMPPLSTDRLCYVGHLKDGKRNQRPGDFLIDVTQPQAHRSHNNPNARRNGQHKDLPP
jgi:hypothetical protein